MRQRSVQIAARLITTAVGLLSASSFLFSGQASTMVYTSPAAFAAATSNPATYGFNGILTQDQTFASFNPLIVGPLSFSDPDPGVFINVTSATFYSPTNYPADFIIDSGNPNISNRLDIDFPATRALALDFGGFRGGTTSTTFTLSNGFSTTEAPNPLLGQTEFVGFVSTDLITDLQLVSNNDDYVLLYFTLASVRAASIPEPSTLAILSTALICLGLALRRRLGADVGLERRLEPCRGRSQPRPGSEAAIAGR